MYFYSQTMILLTYLLVMYVSVIVAEFSSVDDSNVPVLLNSSALIQQSLKSAHTNDEDSIHVTLPSTRAAVFRHIDDMTFIHTDVGNNRQRRNAVVNPSYLWSDGIIPYIISNIFKDDERRVILQAMQHWEENTCIRFRPKIGRDTHIIFIARGRGCSSFVGRLPAYYQPQGISLGYGCVFFDIVVHELGHALGFYHEHTRPDRDEHVEVIYNNILDGYKDQFSRFSEGRTNTLGIGYDSASIMHYSSDTFTRNGMDTIRARDPTVPFGNAQELSPLDIAKANALYNCGPPESWPSLSTTVPPEPDVTLPPDATCGRVYTRIVRSRRFRAPHFPNYTHNLDCAWVLQVPAGYNLLLTFFKSGIENSPLCAKDYISVYFGTTLSASNLLIRFCTRARRSYIITTNVVTVTLHTDESGGRGRGVSGKFSAIDENECLNSRCHDCTNLPGGFECQCSDGYYHSNTANTCYDVNECAFDNGGCQHDCVNSGGSYRCECQQGYTLQSDGMSCEGSQ